jgi:hypothetical protein
MDYTEAKKILLKAFEDVNLNDVKRVENEFSEQFVLDTWAAVTDFTMGCSIANEIRDYLGPKSQEYQDFLNMNKLMDNRLGEIACDLESSFADILENQYTDEKSKEVAEACRQNKEWEQKMGLNHPDTTLNHPDNTIKGTSSQKGCYLSVEDPNTATKYAVSFRVYFTPV